MAKINFEIDFWRLKIQFIELDFSNLIFQNSSTDQQVRGMRHLSNISMEKKQFWNSVIKIKIGWICWYIDPHKNVNVKLSLSCWKAPLNQAGQIVIDLTYIFLRSTARGRRNLISQASPWIFFFFEQFVFLLFIRNKVHIFWEGHKNLAHLPLTIWRY